MPANYGMFHCASWLQLLLHDASLLRCRRFCSFLVGRNNSYFDDRHSIVDGDAEKALATADVIVEGELKVGPTLLPVRRTPPGSRSSSISSCLVLAAIVHIVGIRDHVETEISHLPIAFRRQIVPCGNKLPPKSFTQKGSRTSISSFVGGTYTLQ